MLGAAEFCLAQVIFTPHRLENFRQRCCKCVAWETPLKLLCLNNARYGISWGVLGAAEFCLAQVIFTPHGSENSAGCVVNVLHEGHHSKYFACWLCCGSTTVLTPNRIRLSVLLPIWIRIWILRFPILSYNLESRDDGLFLQTGEAGRRLVSYNKTCIFCNRGFHVLDCDGGNWIFSITVFLSSAGIQSRDLVRIFSHLSCLVNFRCCHVIKPIIQIKNKSIHRDNRF